MGRIRTRDCVLASVLALLLFANLTTAAASAPLAHSMQARIDAALSRMDVELCLDPGTPSAQRALRAEFDLRRYSDAPRIVVAGREQPSQWRGNPFTLPTSTACVRYRVDLARAAVEGTGMRRPAVRLGRDLKTAVELWFLRPPLEHGDAHIDLEFTLPPGIAVSAPWARRAGQHRYRVERSADNSWGAVVAFGRFTPHRITLEDGAQLELVVLDGNPPPNEQMLARWVRDTADEVRAVHGRFPVRSLQVVLVPLLGNGLWPPPARTTRVQRMFRLPEAVGFGRILRDGGAAAELQIVQTASAAQLRADWTASHEFSHLLLPFLKEPGSWVSEGFADYYQNLLMARAGNYSEVEAWRRLVSGFERGRGDGVFAETLEAAVLRGGENALMRRYWTGAVVALQADIELRRRGDSLDALLGRFARCCLPSTRAWSVNELFARLDVLAGQPTFVGLHDQWPASRAFPVYADSLHALGINGNGTGVTLDNAAPLAAMRRAIMARRVPAAAP